MGNKVDAGAVYPMLAFNIWSRHISSERKVPMVILSSLDIMINIISIAIATKERRSM